MALLWPKVWSDAADASQYFGESWFSVVVAVLLLRRRLWKRNE
jgi:hypothetical protein